MLYKFLSARSPQHDLALCSKIRLLYEGGYAAKEGLKKILDRAPNETKAAFDYRVSRASYMPYFGQLVDYLVGALFAAPIHVTPAGDANDPNTIGEFPDPKFYQLFAKDSDRKGCHFAQLIRECTTEALLCKCAWVAVDMPPAVQAESIAEEDAAGGARGYAYLLPYEEVFDWAEDKDGDGDLSWAIIGRRCIERSTPESIRDTYHERYTVWQKDPASRVVSFTVYETEPVKIGQDIQPETDILQKEKGTTTFARIPLVRFELPSGLWAGNKIGPLAEEHFQRRSDMLGSMARSLHEVPYILQGPEIPGADEGISEAQSDPGRGNVPVGPQQRSGWLVLGSQDKVGFAGPSGKAYEITDKQLHDLRDEIFRSVHAMALSLANTGGTARRSAESKTEDRRATGVVLDYLGTKARELGVNVYKTISDARKEVVVWVAHGLDDFDLEEQTSVVADAEAVQTLDIPSRTFRKEYTTKVALSLLPGLTPDTKSQIQQEISDGVEEKADLAEATQKAMLDNVDGDPADPADDAKVSGGTKATPATPVTPRTLPS